MKRVAVFVILLSSPLFAERRHAVAVEHPVTSLLAATQGVGDPSLMFCPATGFHVQRVLDLADKLGVPRSSLTWRVHLEAISSAIVNHGRAHDGKVDVIVWHGDGRSHYCAGETLTLPATAGALADFTLDQAQMQGGDVLFEDWEGLRIRVDAFSGSTLVHTITQGPTGAITTAHGQAEWTRCVP